MFRRFAILLLILTLCGCKTITTQLREDGFNRQWQSWAGISGGHFEDVFVDIKVRVRVVDDVRVIGNNAAGVYLHPQGIIVLPGKLVQGKIIVPPAVLGHEVQHGLQFQDKQGRFHNPDELKQLGY